MNRILSAGLLMLSLFLSGPAGAQSFFASPLHAFQGTEGAQPQAVVAAPDGSVYGISQNGGSSKGTLFKALADGTVTVLHEFNGSDGSMQFPSCCSHLALASLLVAPGGDLYGYTLTGGNTNCQSGYGCGVVFRYAQASGFSVLWKFTGGSDGSGPSGLVWGSDGNLYGTSFGLPDNNGAVFRLSPAGALQVLHRFCSAPNCADGFGPAGLAEGPDRNFYGHYHGSSAPDYIYRITRAGVITPLVSLLPAIGNNWGDYAGNFVTGSDGAIYFTFDRDNYGSGRVNRYDIATNTLALLHQFDYTDGSPPYRLAVGTAGTLYGTAAGGGRQSLGTSFRIDTPGTLSFLYDFQGPIDGASPTGITQALDGRLFGVAANGGLAPAGAPCSGCGTFFQLMPVAAGAPAVTKFNAASGPAGMSVTVTGSRFTGTRALQFGTVPASFTVQNDQALTATVPAGLQVPVQLSITNAAGTGYVTEPFEPSAYRYSTLYSFCPGSPYPNCADGAGPGSLIQSVDGNFYGTTSFNFSSSVLFRLTPAGAESVLVAGLNFPNPIVESGTYFYGTTQYGGYFGTGTGCNNSENPTGCGTIFRVNRSTGALTTLYKFKGLADGSFPRSNVLAIGGTGSLYGSTPSTLFKFQGLLLRTQYKFNAASDGNKPAALVDGQDGSVYGVNAAGGPSGQGTVFRFNTVTAAFQVLHAFVAGEGSGPSALVRAADGSLYGVTQAGGAQGKGSLFRIDASGNFATLYSFSAAGALGNAPGGIALGKDGALYGYTSAGASLGGGVVFRMASDGSSGTPLYAFFPSNTASGHGYRPTSLFQGANGDWFGTTYNGGATGCAYGEGCGAVFQIH